MAPCHLHIGTEWSDNEIIFGTGNSSWGSEDPGVKNFHNFSHFIEVPGKFCLSFASVMAKDANGELKIDNKNSPENANNPAAIWYAKSLIELFKIMREWAILVDSPFNSQHPMATYSKMVFDTLKPTKAILTEIDSLPDMHLARFLKGDENHRQRIEDFPQMSESMMTWFKKKMEQYPKTSTREKLKNLVI